MLTKYLTAELKEPVRQKTLTAKNGGSRRSKKKKKKKNNNNRSRPKKGANSVPKESNADESRTRKFMDTYASLEGHVYEIGTDQAHIFVNTTQVFIHHVGQKHT